MLNFANFHKPLYYVRINLTRNLYYKSDQLVKWVKVDKISPVDPKVSGDLKPLEELPIKEIAKDFKNCTEIESITNDYVKRLFTYEFLPKHYVIQHKKEELMDSVKNHKLDTTSKESKIAKWTIQIRYLQEIMKLHPYNKQTKNSLKELIDRRKKYLKILRYRDYKKFEWLLEKLSLLYIPAPINPHPVTRADSIRKLTEIYCENIRQQKLQEYRESLENQKEDFLKGKIATLEKIMQDENSFGVSPSITQEDIDLTVKQLREFELKSKVKATEID